MSKYYYIIDTLNRKKMRPFGNRAYIPVTWSELCRLRFNYSEAWGALVE